MIPIHYVPTILLIGRYSALIAWKADRPKHGVADGVHRDVDLAFGIDDFIS